MPRQGVLVDLSLWAILRLSSSSCLHDQPCAARNPRRSTSSGHRFPFAPRCLGGAALPRLGVRVDLSLWAILRLSSFSCLHDQPCTARHPRRSICLGYWSSVVSRCLGGAGLSHRGGLTDSPFWVAQRLLMSRRIYDQPSAIKHACEFNQTCFLRLLKPWSPPCGCSYCRPVGKGHL